MINIPEEVKALFRTDNVKKNIRVHFPNGERADITNANINEEDFTFTENLCSQDSFKLGLCESNIVQFTCEGIENIKGYEIEVYHEIDISSLGDDFIATYAMTSDDVTFPYYRLPYGVFTVDECQRQADMKKRKVVAYNHLSGLEINRVVEKRKQSAYEQQTCEADSYKFDVFKFIVSNYVSDSEFLPKEVLIRGSASILSSQITLNDGEYWLKLNVSGCIYNCNTLASSKELYFIQNRDYKENKKAFRSLFDDFWDECEREYGISYEHGKESAYSGYERYLFPYLSNDSFGYIFINDGSEYIYPFYNFSSYTGIDVIAPSSVTLTLNHRNDSGRTEVLTEETFTIRDEAIIYKVDTSDWLSTEIETKKLTDLNIREIVEAYTELQGRFITYDRYGTAYFHDMKGNFALHPSEALYPSDALYPYETNGGMIQKSQYVSAWYDEVMTKPFDRVTVTYTNADGKDVYAYHQIIPEDSEGYNADDYQTYSLGWNYLIQNGVFTADQIKTILSTVAENIKDVRYMPADIKLQGLPWIEAGDVVEIITKDSAIETVVLRRTLSGIQSLADNYESK